MSTPSASNAPGIEELEYRPHTIPRLLRYMIGGPRKTTFGIAVLLRVVALGYVLGQTALADAYKLANETPNIVYELLLGGVLSATLVPLFSTFAEDDDEEATNVENSGTSVADRTPPSSSS